ncbi:MAG: universal stress protein [Saprospiraceae bacterium]
MKTILVATDFSAAASHAAEYAADMAMAIQANLFILHVFQIPINYSEMPLAVSMEELMLGPKEEIIKLQNELIQRTKNNIKIDSEVIEGLFFGELNTFCERLNPFSVIIGTQGKTRGERLFFGSEAIYTMKHLEWPIIAVPINSDYRNIQKIGLACDLNELGEIPVDDIQILAKDFNAELIVINTSKKETHSMHRDASSSALFERFAESKPQYHFIYDKNVDEATLDFAEKSKLDLLIVLPKRHSLISQLLFKSHTREFVMHSHVPVMALHK